MRLDTGVAHATQNLHDFGCRRRLDGMDVVDHAQQRLAPRGNSDRFTASERRFQIVRGRLADPGQDLFFAILAALRDDHFGQSERVAQPFLQLRIGAARHVDRDPHDVFLARPAQQPRDRRLRDVQPLGDIRLLHPFGVIHARDACGQTELVNACHAKRSDFGVGAHLPADETSVNEEVDAGAERRRSTNEKDRGADELIDRGHAPHRR